MNANNLTQSDNRNSLATFLFANDFFYYNLLPFCDAFELSLLLTLNKKCARRATVFLQSWLAHGWGLPDREVYEELSEWEISKGIKIPADLKCFYASWREQTVLDQRMIIPRRFSASALRELRLSHRSESLSELTTPDFLCLAMSEMCSAHKDWDVSLITFVDLRGQLTGIPGTIFDYEYVDHGYFASGIHDMKEDVYCQIEMNRNDELYQGHGYMMRKIRMTAHNIFELISMMKNNQFYHDDPPSEALYEF